MRQIRTFFRETRKCVVVGKCQRNTLICKERKSWKRSAVKATKTIPQEGILGVAAYNKRVRDPDKGSSRRPRSHDQARPFSFNEDRSKIEQPNTTLQFPSLIILIGFYLATCPIKSRRVLYKISPHAARNLAACLMKCRPTFMKSRRPKQPVNSQCNASLFRQADFSPPDRTKLHARAQQKNAHHAWNTNPPPPPLAGGKHHKTQNLALCYLLLCVMGGKRKGTHAPSATQQVRAPVQRRPSVFVGPQFRNDNRAACTVQLRHVQRTVAQRSSCTRGKGTQRNQSINRNRRGHRPCKA